MASESDDMSSAALTARLAERIAAIDWPGVEAALDADGVAVAGRLFDERECAALRGLYDHGAHFRSRVIMARHGFGSGEYQYFSYPLPPPVAVLRAALWPHLRAVANRWSQALGRDLRYPPAHADYLAACHAKGQARPTPLMPKMRRWRL